MSASLRARPARRPPGRTRSRPRDTMSAWPRTAAIRSKAMRLSARTSLLRRDEALHRGEGLLHRRLGAHLAPDLTDLALRVDQESVAREAVVDRAVPLLLAVDPERLAEL